MKYIHMIYPKSILPPHHLHESLMKTSMATVKKSTSGKDASPSPKMASHTSSRSCRGNSRPNSSRTQRLRRQEGRRGSFLAVRFDVGIILNTKICHVITEYNFIFIELFGQIHLAHAGLVDIISSCNKINRRVIVFS